MSDQFRLKNFEIDGLFPEFQYIECDENGNPLYHWYIFQPEQTIFPLVGMRDLSTGITLSVEVDRLLNRGSIHALAMAKRSRSPLTAEENLFALRKNTNKSDLTIAKISGLWRHGSTGDPSAINIEHDNVPFHMMEMLATADPIHAAQCQSSRFQAQFGRAHLHSIDNYLNRDIPQELRQELTNRYNSIGEMSTGFYNELQPLIRDSFIEFFQPEEGNKQEWSSLESRVYDVARGFVQYADIAAFGFETSPRWWSKLIQYFRSSHNPLHLKYADQVEHLLTPSEEVENHLKFKAPSPGLIHHTEADFTVNENMLALYKFLLESTDFSYKVSENTTFEGLRNQSVRMIGPEVRTTKKNLAQYIITLFPGVNVEELLAWIESLSITQQKIISQIMLNNHNRFKELPTWAAVSAETMFCEISLAVARDLLRHRGQDLFTFFQQVYGRPTDYNTAKQILAWGFTISPYFNIEGMSEIKSVYIDRLEKVYAAIYDILEWSYSKFGDNISYEFIINLLPFAHIWKFWMHSDIKQGNFMPDLRTQPGGDIAYIDASFEYNNAFVGNDPLLSAMLMQERPDPANRKNFFDRS